VSNIVKRSVEYFTKPMPLEEFGDYNNYWNKRDQDNSLPPIARAKTVSSFIEPNSTILDIGCGDGMVIEYLLKHNSPKRIVGIDISSKVINNLKSKGYECFQMDILSEDFLVFIKNNNFDYIIITEVLEHINEPEVVMRALKGKFTKNVIASIPNSGFLYHRVRLLFGKFPIVSIIYHVKEHVRFWTHGDFLYWCKYLGFSVVKCKAYTYPNILGLNASKLSVSLFGQQIIYVIK
jgi:methionine biosynthesis protein MetW